MEQPPPKTCPRCGASFECGLANGEETCWCFESPRLLPVIENAKCLCPECLRAEIASRTQPQSSQSVLPETSDE